MSNPKAYDPQEGYRYHILCRNPDYGRRWEHCDYARDNREKNYLIGEYSLGYGPEWQFKAIVQPRKYWPTKEDRYVRV